MADETSLWLHDPTILIPLDPFLIDNYQPSQSKGLIQNINILARLIIIFSIIGTIILTDKNTLQEGGKYLAFLAVVTLFIPENHQESYFNVEAGNQPIKVNQPVYIERKFNVHNNRSRWGPVNANNLGTASQVTL